MFVQVISGVISDEAGLRRSVDHLISDLEPGAVGRIGTTAGTCDDGTFVAVFRFESAEAATNDRARPEQHLWWAEVEQFFDGGFTVTEHTDAAQLPDTAEAGTRAAIDDAAADPNEPGRQPRQHRLVERIKDVWHDITYGQERLVDWNRLGRAGVPPPDSPT